MGREKGKMMEWGLKDLLPLNQRQGMPSSQQEAVSQRLDTADMVEIESSVLHSRVDQLTAKEYTQNNQHHILVTSSNLVNAVKLMLLI